MISWSSLRPADRLNLAFLVFLLFLSGFSHSLIPEVRHLLLLYLSLIVLQLLLFAGRDRHPLLRLLYDFVLPTVTILLIFDSLGLIVHRVNPHDIDSSLIRLDYLLTGGYPTVMLESIANPILTDLLQLAYVSYYLLPLSLGGALLAAGRKEEFERSLFLIMLCFYLSYVGYLLMPALGPRFTIAHLQHAELQGWIVTKPVQDMLNRLEGIKRDAFPSGHTAVALTVLYLAARFSRPLFFIFLPCVFALIVSTVYCRYHYLSDVLAGIALALITVIIGESYYAYRTKKIGTRS